MNQPQPTQDTSLDYIEDRWIKGIKCPACKTSSLFLAKGNYITCGNLECKEPDFADALAQQQANLLQVIEDEAEVYNIKSRNGEIVEPNTGVMAVPLEALKQIKERL
jgi:Zn ribbon nucleic-acid-binding protein